MPSPALLQSLRVIRQVLTQLCELLGAQAARAFLDHRHEPGLLSVRRWTADVSFGAIAGHDALARRVGDDHPRNATFLAAAQALRESLAIQVAIHVDLEFDEVLADQSSHLLVPEELLELEAPASPRGAEVHQEILLLRERLLLRLLPKRLRILLGYLVRRKELPQAIGPRHIRG